MGGDRSIALPLLRAHSKKYGPLVIIQFASHPDTWNREYPEHPYSHGTPFQRALEEGLIDREAYVQFGICSPVGQAGDLAEAQLPGAQHITINRAPEIGVPALVGFMHAAVGVRPTYLSLDIDAADPAFAPGKGTPEVGGLTGSQRLELVGACGGSSWSASNIVEVNPSYDLGGIL